MKYSFIIPCYNSEKTISSCLEAIVKTIKNAGIESEIIVVDNMSTDKTQREVCRFPARLVQLGQRSRSKARNLGASLATGDFLCFVDSDILLSEYWLSKVEEIVSARQELTGFSFISRPLPPSKSTIASRLNFELIAIKSFLTTFKNTRVFLNSKNCIIKRSHFYASGGFDEVLKWYEDLDLSIRLGDRHFLEVFNIPNISFVLDTDIKFRTMIKKSFFVGKESLPYIARWGPRTLSESYIFCLKRDFGLVKHFYRNKSYSLFIFSLMKFSSFFLGATVGLIKMSISGERLI